MLVVKLGGGAEVNYETFADDVAGLVQGGRRLVIVHGGSHDTNELSERLGKPPRFVTSVSGYQSRFTDAETMEIFAMVYAGKINTMLTAMLQQRGVNAVGMSGVDGRLAEGARKDTLIIRENGRRRVLRGDHSGRVERVNSELLNLLLDAGYTPVISPPAISDAGEVINVDGDRMAATMAATLGANTLAIFTDRPGLLRDPEDESTLIEGFDLRRLETMQGYAEGRMRIKLLAAQEALEAGVERVILADGRAQRPISRALDGNGTTIVARSSSTVGGGDGVD